MRVHPVDQQPQNSNPSHPLITAYLRQTDKSGFKIELMSSIMLWHLQELITEKTQIPVQQQLLFICSQKYFQSPNQLLKISPNSIIHVHSKEEESHKAIKISIQLIDEAGKLEPCKELFVSVQAPIGATL